MTAASAPPSAAVPEQCQPLADELEVLKLALPALRDAVAAARGVSEEAAQRELAAALQAVDRTRRAFDACAGITPPQPVLVPLQGRTDISIDTRGDGSWTGAILTEMVSTYTLTFLGPRAAITGTPPPTNVGGGFVQGGPFGLIPVCTSTSQREAGGVYGAYDAAAGP